MMSSRRFSLPRELPGAWSGRSTSRFGADWIENQLNLNYAVSNIQQGDASFHDIKVIQTFRSPLSVHHLLEAMEGSKTVRSASFIGIHFGEAHSSQLATVLEHPNTALEFLQLCRLLPAGIPPLCRALQKNKSLKELRLTFCHDIPFDKIRLLMQALKDNQSIQILKIFCLNLDDAEALNILAGTVAGSPNLIDLRLTQCNLREIGPLARAIRSSASLKRLDLSMNAVADHTALATLLQTQSLQHLCLTQNEIGKTHEGMDAFCDALQQNTTLTHLVLDMNPLSQTSAHQLLDALEQNTTLMRLGLLTLTLPHNLTRRLRHTVSLNKAGRGWMRNEKAHSSFVPKLVERVSKEPDLIYGLLRERPHLWLAHKRF